MTLILSLDCGCSAMLISDGDEHRTSAVRPCDLHRLFVAESIIVKLLRTRVRVKVIEDDK